MRLEIALIRTDGGTQPREAINADVVRDYSAAMVDGDLFPPVVVYHDGTDYWLADGFHRVRAAEAAGLEDIDAQVLMGGQRNAILFSTGANDRHGLRRTNADKRRAVMRLLEDVEWSAWSDRQIANACKVNNHLVASLRLDVTGRTPSEKTYTTKHGTTATMNTTKIGKKPFDAEEFQARVDLATSQHKKEAEEEERRRAERPDPIDLADIRKQSEMIIAEMEKISAWKDRIRLSHEGRDDAFVNALMEYLEGLDDDSRRVETCYNIIKVCKGIANELQREGARA